MLRRLRGVTLVHLMLAILGISVLTFIVSIMIQMFGMLPVFGSTMVIERITAAAAFGIAYSIGMLGAAVAWTNGVRTRFILSGLIMGSIALIGYIIWMCTSAFAWGEPIPLLSYNKVLIWPAQWALLASFSGLLLMIQPRALWWIGLRRATICAFGAFAAAVCIVVTTAPGFGSGDSLLSVWFREELTTRILSMTLSGPFVMLLIVAIVAAALTLPWPVKQFTARALAVILLCSLLALVIVGMAVDGVGTYRWIESTSQFQNDFGYYRSFERHARIGSAVSMLIGTVAVAVAIMTLVVALIHRLEHRPLLFAKHLPFRMTCPRCGREQQALTGGQHCENCRLLVRLEFS